MSDYENVKVLVLSNGSNILCQVTEMDDNFVSITNPVTLEADNTENRINMNPMIRFAQKNTDVVLPVTNVELMYIPTVGLQEEYIAVFVEETKEATETSEEETAGAEETEEVEVEV
tara:strand:+ start:7383 stop:7730 length:348 start_codon:yes stop_codon:yes gene_type:complete